MVNVLVSNCTILFRDTALLDKYWASHYRSHRKGKPKVLRIVHVPVCVQHAQAGSYPASRLKMLWRKSASDVY